jgi:hypothetical protein
MESTLFMEFVLGSFMWDVFPTHKKIGGSAIERIARMSSLD